MTFLQEYHDCLELRDSLEVGKDINFERLAWHGVVLDPLNPIPRGPSMLGLVQRALSARAVMYRKLHELEFPTD